MRSFALLLALLGLFALAQAQTSDFGGVLLEGAVAEEDIPQSGNVSVLHRHWRHHGPPHDPEDHPYWERRHSAKAELFDCLGFAIHHFDEKDADTWKWTGDHIAKCFLRHLSHCHDLPGLPEDIRTFLPYVMFVNGLDALVKEGDDGLRHATMVLGFYLAGGTPAVPANPWYVPGGCASKLVAYLKSGCEHRADRARLLALAKTFVKALETNQLGACLPDVPAVILSLVSTYCPPSGVLYNPLDPTATPVTCTNEGAPLYEKSAGALLGGSIISLLLLSNNAKLATLGTSVAFAMNRMALAATQTTSFDGCLGTPLTPGQGELATALGTITAGDGIPTTSGPIVLPLPATPVKGISLTLPLLLDGQRTLCAAIAMVSGPDPANWMPNLLWQGSANILNAVFGTIAAGVAPGSLTPVVITDPQIAGLCAVAKAVYSFTEVPTTSFDGTVDVTIPTNSGNDFSCMTSPAPGCAPPVAWGTIGNNVALEAGHAIDATSPATIICGGAGIWRTAAPGSTKKPVGRRGL